MVTVRLRKRATAALALAIFVPALAAQSPLPPPFPRPNATLLLETDRIAIWNIVWPKGQPTRMHRHVYDQVGTYYAAGGRVITQPNGDTRQAMTAVGSLSTTKKGTTHIEEGTTDPPLRAVFIELKKDAASGLPDAMVDGPPVFPRAGVQLVQDDERVAAWDVTWASGAGGFRYRAARETIIVWLGAGRARVTDRTGAATLLDVQPGTMRHLDRGAAETIEMASGAPRAIVFQLK